MRECCLASISRVRDRASRLGIWPDHLTFCVIFVLFGINYLKWPHTVFLAARCSNYNWVTSIFFSSKQKNFGITGKIIRFWLARNQEPRVKCDITRRNKVSKFVALRSRNHKIKVIKLYPVSWYSVSKIFGHFLNYGYFLVFWKGIFHRMIFLSPRFRKNSYIFIKQEPRIF